MSDVTNSAPEAETQVQQPETVVAEVAQENAAAAEAPVVPATEETKTEEAAPAAETQPETAA